MGVIQVGDFDKEQAVSARYAGAGVSSSPRRRHILKPRGTVEVDVKTAIAGIAVDLGPLARFSANLARERREVPTVERLGANRSIIELTVMVESRLVEASWTLARLPDRSRGWLHQAQHGLSYLQEGRDRWANAVDPATGKDVGFGAEPGRPAPPSAQEVGRWVEAMSWLHWLRAEHARVVFAAALSRRGDMAKRVSWRKAREFSGLNVSRQRLAVIYDGGIAEIAGRLVMREAAGIRQAR